MASIENTHQELTRIGREHADNCALLPTDSQLWGLARNIDPARFGVEPDPVDMTSLRDAYDEGRRPTQVGLDVIAAELGRFDVATMILHSSGNCATLYAAPNASWPGRDANEPWTVTLGPCDYVGPGHRHAYIDTAESVSYGPPNDDRHSQTVPYLAQPAEVAALVAAAVNDDLARRQRVGTAIDEATAAFWNQLAAAFPEITTDEVDPAEGMRIEQAMRHTATLWIDDNQPPGGIAATAPPQQGFAQLTPDEIRCALHTLAEIRDDPHAELSEVQDGIADRVVAIWRAENDDIG
ncbi:hypothetical protein [Actinoplanes derwentensis]|uniref:Uncharacterized protein n=1 Tax=Actinoplanes derwentensis TaxID=113562 RepID=A0A1H2CUP7_9ACTN|nr:hypothetical protein [Actinoplanes derwentensis]GID81962.1 hypothetical protein Ade03nite_08860 [Actinoplanes derwentensis]SDT74215.1 hypothetical protein SAMN04489716_6911 [Actinoplanes derwentensis]